MRIHEICEAASDPLPRKFWLVFDIPTYKGISPEHEAQNEAKIRDIASGDLQGVLGISSSRQIITGWFCVARNAAVVMDPAQVAADNDVEQIHYDDPDWLCRDNFAPLYRIWDKKQNKWGHDGFMMNLARYVIDGISDYRAKHSINYYGGCTKFATVWQEHHDQYHVSDFASALAAFEHMFAIIREKDGGTLKYDEGMNTIDWGAALTFALKQVGDIYKDESEWLVTTPSFKVPKGSIMLVAINVEAAKLYDDWKKDPNGKPELFGMQYALEAHDKLMNIMKQNRLDHHYTIRLIDGRKFENLRPDVMTRRNKR